MTDVLLAKGYQVTSFANGHDALEQVKSDPDGVDLVITDMTMPKMTGDKLAVELLKIKPELPIILSTGFSKDMDKTKSEQLGIQGFMMKPVVMLDLYKMVRQLLDGAGSIKK